MTQPVERICPECRSSQSLTAHYCATCGAQLERFLPVPARQWLPARIKQQLHHPVVKGVAMGAMALVVEVGINVLRHMVTNRISQPRTSIDTSHGVPSKPPARTVIHARRRFWQKSDGHGNIRSEEQITWQRTDQ